MDNLKKYKNIVNTDNQRAFTPKDQYNKYLCKECNKRLKTIGQVKIHKCSLKYNKHLQ